SRRLGPVEVTRARTLSVLVLATLAVVALATTAHSASDPVVRTVYGTATPINAPGQSLGLQQVTIAPGAKLAEHFHAGTQVATIRSGVLTSDVVSGSVAITRANGKAETAAGPATITLRKGDTIVEVQSLVHFGSNKGKVPV